MDTKYMKWIGGIGAVIVIVLALVAVLPGTSRDDESMESADVRTELPAGSSQSATPAPVTSIPKETTPPQAGGTKPATPPAPVQAPGTYTMAQVATHNSASSCWTVVNGNVYDVTAWISQHPGGRQSILSMCGRDGSAAFDNQHGGQRRPEAELASFKIGALAS